MSNLLKTAKVKCDADKEFGKAFRAEMAALKPMDVESFWPLCEEFAKKVQSRVKNGNPIEDGFHNLICGSIDSVSDWERFARFTVRYEQVKTVLSKKCWELKGLERGDDGYGDLMDSLPLAGKAVFDGLMDDDIANYKQLEAALDEHPLKDFILNGENYVCMKTEEKLKEAFTWAARRERDDSEDEYREPDPHVVMVTTQEKKGYTLFGMQVNVRGPFQDRYEAEAFAKQEDGACTVVKLFGGVVKK